MLERVGNKYDGKGKEYDRIDTSDDIANRSIEEKITRKEREKQGYQDRDWQIKKSRRSRKRDRSNDRCDTEDEKNIGNIGTEHISDRNLCIATDSSQE